MIDSPAAALQVLLLIAALVAMLVRRLHLPYTVGLVLAGIGIAFFPVTVHFPLTKQLIFSTFLPPMIFEAALHLPWQELRRNAVPVITLASVGTLLSAAVSAAAMHGLAGWPWISAWLFGVLIAATDPVSVIATFKEAGVKGRLRLLMEAESLLNDGTAAVAFVIVLTIAAGGSVTAVGIVRDLLLTVSGSILCGIFVAGAVLLIAGRASDPLIEITLTSVVAYGSFLLAEHMHFSGVLATLTAGIMVGTGATSLLSEKGREAVISFWDYAAFVINSLIFILIGLSEAHQDFRAVLLPAAIAIIFVTAGRAVAIYPIAALLHPIPRWRISLAHQHILVWGGLRGALALALVLGLPEGIPRRADIITVAFAVVAFSVIVQGLTMQPLLRRLGEIPRRRPE